MYNKVILIGNLTRDPELRYTPSGHPVASFGLACNRKYNSNGQVKEEVYYGKIVVWGKQGENCSKYLTKGSKALVEGRLTTEKWEKDGEAKSKTRIIAEQVKFLSSKGATTSTASQCDYVPDDHSDLGPF